LKVASAFVGEDVPILDGKRFSGAINGGVINQGGLIQYSQRRGSRWTMLNIRTAALFYELKP